MSEFTSQSSIQHVILILEENEAYSSVIGSSQAPYQNQLADQYSLAANYFSPEHPSLPNYLDLTAASDLGLTSDCSPPSSCPLSNSTNITDLLIRHALTWKAYEESMPSPCYMQDNGGYVTKHDPFVYYPDITTSAAYCDSHVVPYEDPNAGFLSDLKDNNLPNYSFITPNLCNDGHDPCSATITQVQQVDQWLSALIPKIMSSPEFASTAIFIVYDEGSASLAQSQVPCIVVSPMARHGYQSSAEYTHFSLVATVESIFGLGDLDRNDTTAAVMQDMFTIPI